MRSESGKKKLGSELARLRGEIDEIDTEILALLFERQNRAKSIGEKKYELGMAVLDTAREAEVIRRLTAFEGPLLSRESIRHIFTEVISAGRAIQGQRNVAYLGPEGSFSHQAAAALFGISAPLTPARSVHEIFDMVGCDRCSEGVVPVENSLEGEVGPVHDLLCGHDLLIERELVLRVRQHLLGKAERLEDIEVIYSHPMALFQCAAWIERNLPDAQQVGVPSTSEAARLASVSPRCAAVGSSYASRLYNLSIMARDIEDSPHNFTRFFSIGKRSSPPTGKDKTSVVISVKHEPGALTKALEPFASRGVNMTRIVSRPFKGRRWEYLFFLDLEGHMQEEPLRMCLDQVSRSCQWMKSMGSYPKGDEPWE
jgi:chorismate mutase/prephenate dehydratase